MLRQAETHAETNKNTRTQEIDRVDGSKLGLAANQRCQLAAQPFTVKGCRGELGIYQLGV